MSKLTIAFVLDLTATATYAFDKATAQSQTAATECPPTVNVGMRALLLCSRKQTSLGENIESAHARDRVRERATLSSKAKPSLLHRRCPLLTPMWAFLNPRHYSNVMRSG